MKKLMREAIVNIDATVKLQESPVPSPGPHEVLVKVMVAGVNPKDWKFPSIAETPHNSGDDVAGIVEDVGSCVWEFTKGDRVAGLHAFPEPYGAYAEYAILPDHQMFRLPPNISFEEGATIPLAALAACFALFYNLELPAPWQKPIDKPTPLLINGASCAVGAYAIQLATTARIHPIVAVGSPNSKFVSGRLRAEEGDALVDYWAHPEPKSLVKCIKKAFSQASIPYGRATHAIDCVSMPGTFDAVVSCAMAAAVDKPRRQQPEGSQRPRMAVLLPGSDYSSADESVEVLETYTGVAHQGGELGKRFAYTACRMFALGLSDGWLKPHPHEAREGLESVQQALYELRQGKVRAKKLVIRIGAADIANGPNGHGQG